MSNCPSVKSFFLFKYVYFLSDSIFIILFHFVINQVQVSCDVHVNFTLLLNSPLSSSFMYSKKMKAIYKVSLEQWYDDSYHYEMYIIYTKIHFHNILHFIL